MVVILLNVMLLNRVTHTSCFKSTLNYLPVVQLGKFFFLSVLKLLVSYRLVITSVCHVNCVTPPTLQGVIVFIGRKKLDEKRFRYVCFSQIFYIEKL